jgi:hypothetical protein
MACFLERKFDHQHAAIHAKFLVLDLEADFPSREAILRQAHHYGLDVCAITKRSVQNMFQSYSVSRLKCSFFFL